MPPTPPLIEASGIAKSFAGVHALSGVSFELHSGEVHALVGENGAGKSTFIRILAGAIAPDAGTVKVSGHTVTHHTPSYARALGIAAVHQQPALFPHLSVEENIALSLEGGGLWRTIDWKRRASRAAQLLERAAADIRPDRLVSTLSMPEQRLVEIAKSIGANARVL